MAEITVQDGSDFIEIMLDRVTHALREFLQAEGIVIMKQERI